jgi:hypothetical protein
MSRVRSIRRKRTHMRGGAKTPMQAIIAANKKAVMKGVPKIGKQIVKHGKVIAGKASSIAAATAAAAAGKVVTGAWEGSKDLGKQLLIDTGIKGYLDGFDRDKVASGLARQSWGANVALVALGYEPINKIQDKQGTPLRPTGVLRPTGELKKSLHIPAGVDDAEIIRTYTMIEALFRRLLTHINNCEHGNLYPPLYIDKLSKDLKGLITTPVPTNINRDKVGPNPHNPSWVKITKIRAALLNSEAYLNSLLLSHRPQLTSQDIYKSDPAIQILFKESLDSNKKLTWIDLFIWIQNIPDTTIYENKGWTAVVAQQKAVKGQAKKKKKKKTKKK